MIHHEIIFQEIDLFYNFDVLVNGETIAHLSHDCDNALSPWVVAVKDKELYRGNTYDQAKTWIETSYYWGTLAPFSAAS